VANQMFLVHLAFDIEC